MRQRSCPICGKRLKRSNRTKDHFMPKSLGGDGSPENTWAMCKPCNNRKGNRMPNEAETRAMERYRARNM